MAKINVMLVDQNEAPISPGAMGGGTQYAQGGAAVALPTGTGVIFFDAANNPLIVRRAQPLPVGVFEGGNQVSLATQATLADLLTELGQKYEGGAIALDGATLAALEAIQAASAGDVAHDAVDSGNPIKQGFKARNADPTAVANNDRVDATADTLGKQVVLLGAIHDLQSNGTATLTNATAADVIAAAGAGVRIAVTAILVTNAHATVATKVEIRDGATVKIQGYAAAAGGGFAHNGGSRPLFISTANTAITARCVTTGADVDVSISGYRIAN